LYQRYKKTHHKYIKSPTHHAAMLNSRWHATVDD